MHNIVDLNTEHKTMTPSKWKKLLKELEIETTMGAIAPVDKVVLDSCENDLGGKLPSSYRSFCSVFGAGEFAREFRIAVPGFEGESETYSLLGLQKLSHEGLEYDEYSPDPEQHARSVFFAVDILRSKYFLDPNDTTDASKNEYGVYVLFRDWEVRRIADNFWGFVTELCLGERHKELIDSGGPPEQVFRPVSK